MVERKLVETIIRRQVDTKYATARGQSGPYVPVNFIIKHAMHPDGTPLLQFSMESERLDVESFYATVRLEDWRDTAHELAAWYRAYVTRQSKQAQPPPWTRPSEQRA